MAPVNINELPTEIIMQILVFTLPEDPWDWGIGLVQQLALVCRRWLSITLSAPELWPTVDSRQGYRTIGAVLAHNLTGPLNVRLRVAPFAESSPFLASVRGSLIPSGKRFIEIISPHAHRWRDIDLMGYLSTDTVSAIQRAEAAEYLQLLVISGWSQPSAKWRINISRLNRLKCLRISGVQLRWDGPPRFPFLRILTISFTALPPIDQLHTMLESAKMLDSISLHNIDEYPSQIDEEGWTNQGIARFKIVPLTELTNVHLNMVPTEISTHLLTHLDAPGPLALAGNHLDAAVLLNDNFRRILRSSITTFQRIRVDIVARCLRVHTQSGDRIEDGTAQGHTGSPDDFLDLEFKLLDPDRLAIILQSLGLSLESRRITLTVHRHEFGPLDVGSVLWELLPALTPVDDIWVAGGWAMCRVVEVLLEKRVDDMGDLKWVTPRLQYLAVQDVLMEEEEDVLSALRVLWEKRYVRLGAGVTEGLATESPPRCSPLRRLLMPDEWMVGMVVTGGLIPGVDVDIA
ncbi:hypothetical protein FRC04_012149 [Tulasnella sp. 424]|nr:hypothetical protein FRC04_012149 [Tulasnella sp. 424]KAG8971043.1 hypothetical protein FRC05_011509 [Tulasnella sp. 425]